MKMIETLYSLNPPAKNERHSVRIRILYPSGREAIRGNLNELSIFQEYWRNRKVNKWYTELHSIVIVLEPEYDAYGEPIYE